MLRLTGLRGAHNETGLQLTHNIILSKSYANKINEDFCGQYLHSWHLMLALLKKVINLPSGLSKPN